MHDKLVILGVLGFLSGILCRSFLFMPWSAILVLVLLGFVFALLYLLQKRALYLALVVLCTCSALGAGRTALAPSALPPPFADLPGTHVTLEGRVVKAPDARETTVRPTIAIAEEGSTTKLLAVVPRYPIVRLGDVVRVSGEAEEPEPFEGEAGRWFAYDDFLAKDGVFLIMQPATITVIEERSGWWHIPGILADVKTGFLDMLGRGLPEPHASLAGGLVAGGKQGLGNELLTAFTQAGLVHIVVLSGYNVMIVAEAVLAALGVLSGRAAGAAAAVVIGLFVLAAGAGAASIRAGLMAGLGLYARATGRTYVAFRALIAVGILMLLWNPYLLAFDPGFQLSFVATLGLIFGTPILEPHLRFIRTTSLRDIVASTLAAQVAVLPLILFNTGLLSLISLPANILVLPVIPLAMLFSAFAGLAGFLVPSFAPILSLPAYTLLSYVIAVAEQVNKIPGATVSLPVFSFFLVVLAYALLAAFVLTHERQSAPRQPAS